ncbi:hypothetical protein W97_08116 [Coniosporium apollinis CBS 100218]|uniref:Survival Motor Neuron Gemin2-binding domain-containing protein n=1 Tax=Coniosporium apollinis (strain CBS 100218) TaxID=1168221 RepID=R7Z427_CONA1|nr:uncharacterized protein W97_08116 [Coniosporium apollinis CBS 100218]EON68858.1 hypothetical protein W97_08116 [Coniosporium apollinis CBS 100218]
MSSHKLSYADVWDDSALIQSWEAALAEYKKYHSIHARGEKVEDVLSAFELAELRGTQDQPNGATAPDRADVIKEGELQMTHAKELGELEEGEDAVEGTADDQPVQMAAAAVSAEPTGNGVTGSEHTMPPVLTAMPQVLAGSIQDEALKNLMMSWYYAGYYTGLYEGQQKVVQNSMGEGGKY